MGNTQSAEGFDASTNAADIVRGRDLHGNVYVITGASSGIGREAARVLLTAGASVVLACRSSVTVDALVTDVLALQAQLASMGQPTAVDAAEAVPIEVNREASSATSTVEHAAAEATSAAGDSMSADSELELRSRIRILPLDLASLASVREFVHLFEQLEWPVHCLINNAGVMMLPNYETSVDGIEKQFATNHLGHFLLTVLMLPHLLRSFTGMCLVSIDCEPTHSLDSPMRALDCIGAALIR
jgi:NAD(P)-dependent dehydrogenase (short-subunit alcohol dehydrogenase family)